MTHTNILILIIIVIVAIVLLNFIVNYNKHRAYYMYKYTIKTIEASYINQLSPSDLRLLRRYSSVWPITQFCLFMHATVYVVIEKVFDFFKSLVH